MKQTEVVVVGQGYVGLPLSIAIAEAGFKVLGFDLNGALVEKLNAGISHIEDIPSESLGKSLKNVPSYDLGAAVISEAIKKFNC